MKMVAGATSSTSVVPFLTSGEPGTTADETLQKMTAALVDYDNMLAIARKLNDPRAMKIVSDCKNDWHKRHRTIDPEIKRQLDEDMAKRHKERDELRNRMRNEEADALAAKRQRKKDEAAKKEKADKKKREGEAQKKLQLKIDKNWSEASFGQGLQDKDKQPDFKKEAKVVISNYREAFSRLRLRCPPLPEHLAVQWDDLLEDFGAAWLENHRGRFGNRGGKAFLESVGKLFEDMRFHHVCAERKRLHCGLALQAQSCVCGKFSLELSSMEGY
jgi:hypothetical protein